MIYVYFQRLGLKVGRHPFKTILIVTILSGLCAVGLLKFYQENDGTKLWVPQDSLAVKHQQWVSTAFPSKTLFTTVMLIAPNVLAPAAIKQVLYINPNIPFSHPKDNMSFRTAEKHIFMITWTTLQWGCKGIGVNHSEYLMMS